MAARPSALSIAGGFVWIWRRRQSARGRPRTVRTQHKRVLRSVGAPRMASATHHLIVTSVGRGSPGASCRSEESKPQTSPARPAAAGPIGGVEPSRSPELRAISLREKNGLCYDRSRMRFRSPRRTESGRERCLGQPRSSLKYAWAWKSPATHQRPCELTAFGYAKVAERQLAIKAVERVTAYGSGCEALRESFWPAARLARPRAATVVFAYRAKAPQAI